ncbi:MAG: FAD binding domain-containing protein [Burkholderiales bacterium]|nr:FAD binding domain-containing protein [Burkholderiales bacterium]
MKAAAFEYQRAESVEQACAALAEHGFDAKLIAGGQSLVPMMAMRLARPALLIDINRIAELTTSSEHGDHAVLGACARQQSVKQDQRLAARVPMLRAALAWVGHIQTRNRGTIGGSLAHADPSAELPLAACVLDARIVLRKKGSTRTVAGADFFVAPMQTAAETDECLTEVHWPLWGEQRVGCAFDEVSARHGDFAMVAAAAQVQTGEDGRCTRAAFGLGGVDAVPRAFPDLAARLVGSALAAQDIEAAANTAAGEIEPGEDLHASAAYRRHLARVLVTRVLSVARDRSRVSGANAQ